MVNPTQIANLITEDEQFNKCPVCGDDYAAVAGDEVVCPNKDCEFFNADYAFLEPLEIVDWVPGNLMHDLDYEDWFRLLERATTADHARSVEGQLDDEDLEYVIIMWKGSPNVSDQRLLAALRERL